MSILGEFGLPGVVLGVPGQKHGPRRDMRMTGVYCDRAESQGRKSGKKKAHKHKLFGPVALGTPRECPRDKPGLSLGQSGFVPGTNPLFLLTLHSGSPVCPWDKPSLSRGHSWDEGRQKEFMCQKFMCLFRSLDSGVSLAKNLAKIRKNCDSAQTVKCKP